MANPIMTFDTTEMIMYAEIKSDQKFEKPQRRVLRLTYDKFISISFIPCTERKLFKSVPSEKIVVRLNTFRQPIEFTKLKHKEFFEDYKEGFRAYAQKNRIDLIDETAKQ